MSLENINEKNIDMEDEKKKKLIIKHLVDTYTFKSFNFPSIDNIKIYIVSPLPVCDVCGSGSLNVVRPSRGGRSAVVYLLNGGHECEVFHKNCPLCKAVIYSCYTEFQSEGQVMRKYHPSNFSDYFAVTSETLFSRDLLMSVTEDILTCHSRIINVVEKYNNQSRGKIPLNKKRLLEAWIIFSITQRIPLVFPVIRKLDRAIDIDSICSIVYPELKKYVDSKWINHECSRCQTKIVVMDGCAKLVRTVCAARGEKITNIGEFPKFNACSNPPLLGQAFCEVHINNNCGAVEERLDTGIMTRKRLKELGLSLEELTSDEGCRKRENISIRKDRTVTAGMMYMFRPCGVSLNHTEILHAESCTQFMTMLIEVFGTHPRPEELSGVCIDRACDVHPFAKRLGDEGNEVQLFELLIFKVLLIGLQILCR